MANRKISFVIFVATVGIILASCSTTSQVSNIIMYDNNAIMAREFDVLSEKVVRVEIAQIENARRSSDTRSIHDRILEKVRETYPNADAVLITSLEAVGLVTTSRSGSTERYTYVANVFPIKYR